MASIKCLRFLGNPVFKLEPVYDKITLELVALGKKPHMELTESEVDFLNKYRGHMNTAKPRKIYQYDDSKNIMRSFARNENGSLRRHVQDEKYVFHPPDYLCNIPILDADRLLNDTFGTGFPMFEEVEETVSNSAPTSMEIERIRSEYERQLKNQEQQFRAQLEALELERKKIKKYIRKPRHQKNSYQEVTLEGAEAQ